MVEDIENKQFRMIHIPSFSGKISSPCDIYLKLGDNHFTKIINLKDDLEYETVKKYSSSVEIVFAVKESSFLDFNEYFLNLLYDTDEELPFADKISAQLKASEFVHKTLFMLGISEQHVVAINSSIVNTLDQISSDNDILAILNSCQAGGNYIYEHSLMIAFVSGVIALKMNWSSKHTLNELFMAALLHDALFEDENYARIMLAKDCEGLGLNIFERQNILKHPSVMADMIDSSNCKTTVAAQIIRCHHENVDMTGFPRKMDLMRTSLLTRIFIIAEELVNSLYDIELTEKSLKEVIDEVIERYDIPAYNKIIKGVKLSFCNS